jgi:dipeptidyl aminopeptidase/acylaminoacyl peptidase
MAEYSLNDELVPKEFPGRLGEAYNYMAMVESAIKMLVDQGIAEQTKVGIIGFSRTSWKVDFMLTHSDFKFAAASSADGGLYNFGSYWLWNRGEAISDSEAMLGGPPYGESFQNWLKYAPAFSARHVQAPLLMEYVGYGELPNGPTQAYEFFTALYRQDKPVELFFYPRGNHPLDTPFERVASLQRNLDWFRFWIQGYEGTAPDYDPDQYLRWRKMRGERDRNDGMGSEGRDRPSAHLQAKP